MTKNIVAFIYERVYDIPLENYTMHKFKTYTQLLDYLKECAIHPDDVLVYSDPVEVPFSFLQGLADEEERGK